MNVPKPRIVFMGSPEFAVPVLRALAEHYPVAGVVTQPDKPAGRGKKLTPPPVKVVAQELGLPVMQPRRLKAPEAFAQLQTWDPELIVVAAYGQILRPNVLALPRYGCINVHASLLPRWRGASPVQHAILAGDKETGITIMLMDEGLDTGPILSQRAIPIASDDTAATLSARLATLGAALLLETLPDYLTGALQPQPQPEEGVTYAPLLKKEDGRLDFSKPAEVLARQVRAFNPWPGTFTEWKGGLLKVHRAEAVDAPSPGPGVRLIWQGFPALGTAEGILVLQEVQPAGKRSMPGNAFLHGARDWAADPASPSPG